MSFDLETLKRATSRHGSVCRVVIAQVKGSAPREVGTAMLVWADGQSGTIGGGRLEYDAAAMARKNLDRGIAHSAKSFALGPQLGQCCGGAVVLSFEVFTQGTLPTTFPHAHPVMAVLSQPSSVTQAIAAGVDHTAMIDDWLVEHIMRPKHPVWIYGAGHVGRALVDVLAPLPDFDITWIDTEPARFPDDIPETVTVLPAADPEKAVRHAPRDAHHLILTYSHDMDLMLCDAALRHGFASAGLIGSATKWARFRGRLASLGHTDAQIARITCPIGDPGLGKHPQAIAVGVVAGLVSASVARPSIQGNTA